MQAFDLKSEESSNNNASTPHGHDVNQGWDNEAHLVRPQPGARIISIRVQSPALQAVIKAAVREVTGDALFITAYPSAIAVTSYFRNTLRTSADNLNFPILRRRFEEDRKFTDIISRIVSHPMLVLPLCLIFDHSCLPVFRTSVVA